LAVTVRTEEEQVLKPVVKAVAIDVVQFERESLAAPLTQTALLAALLLEAGIEQPHFDVATAASPAPD
jgi:hypothetical protein